MLYPPAPPRPYRVDDYEPYLFAVSRFAPLKRLALIVSLLEKRPILLLDEWTADQDPDFRRKFYDELLPELKQAGETVVVITHDDRYLAELDLPARKLRMDEGRFVEANSAGVGR